MPLLAGPAYFGVGYLAWMMTQLMLGDANRDWSRRTMFQVPLIASFLMVVWNLSSDPLLSTLRQAWIWRDGGSYFGVPVINFFSWYLTTYIFFQLFSFYLVKTPPQKIQASREYWYQPVTLYGSIACMLMLTGVSAPAAGSVSDPAGMVWSVHQIYAVCALVCTFTMGAFTVLAFLNVSRIPASR